MILQIELKTTGFLIDEWITAKFKIEDGVEGAAQRHVALSDAIALRMGSASAVPQRALNELIDELRLVSRECWDAQEKVCSLHVQDSSIGIHAKRAQEVNAQRTALIRKMDLLLGEGEITVLEKTYE